MQVRLRSKREWISTRRNNGQSRAEGQGAPSVAQAMGCGKWAAADPSPAPAAAAKGRCSARRRRQAWAWSAAESGPPPGCRPCSRHHTDSQGPIYLSKWPTNATQMHQDVALEDVTLEDEALEDVAEDAPCHLRATAAVGCLHVASGCWLHITGRVLEGASSETHVASV
jgi:hypothetical protein